MLMFISFPALVDEWVELGSLASSLRLVRLTHTMSITHGVI